MATIAVSFNQNKGKAETEDSVSTIAKSTSQSEIKFNGDTSTTGMVHIPGGLFMMGGDNSQADKDEYPKHKVTVDGFYMDEHEVTNAQFQKFVDATFSCTTQAFPYQRCHIFGDKGHIEIEFPCNAPIESECKVIMRNAAGEKVMFFKANQYQLQCEAFANSILKDTVVPYTIEDAEKNMKVIDAVLESAALQSLINIEK